ncbi:MAG: bacteriorhodopsin-like [Opitutales bacterium]
METLTIGQYSLVYNMLSFALACMLASFVFFLFARQHVGTKYRMSLLISALVVGIAAYHYSRIFGSWADAFTLSGGEYAPSGKPFNDAYRYVDWLLTVPLLMVELVAVLALAKAKSRSLLARLTIAAFLMIALGYPGEVADNNGTRALWGTLSTIPFVYILYVLWFELGKTMNEQPEKVRVLFRNIRLLTLATWGFYPIAYMGPMIGLTGAGAVVFIQIGYTIADVTAKCGYGIMIYHIARAKTEADGKDPDLEGAGVAKPATA